MLQEITDKELLDKYATHITQSWEWGNFRLTTPNVKKVLRLANSSRVFQIFIHRSPLSPMLSSLFPLNVAYLPRSETPSTEEFLEIKTILKRENCLFLKIEPIRILASISDPIIRINSHVGHPILPQHTIHIDLVKTEDQLLKEMNEKTRYNIRLAEKKGVVIKEESTPEALENFIQLLNLTESRQGFYSHYPNYYRKLWQTLKPYKMVYLLSAYLPESSLPVGALAKAGNQSPVASIMLFHFKDFLYYPYGGSNPEYREYMAPHLLHWSAIKLGKKLKCKTYDLWGSYKNKKEESDPFWGIYRFKSGFGGTEVDFPDSLDIPLSPLYPFYPLVNSLRWQLLRLKRIVL